MTGVCNDLKNRGGCGHGSQHEKFMKENCRKTCGLCDMLVMVTGGSGRDVYLDSVELLHINGSRSCSLPPMPKPRTRHTQSGLIACGGYGEGIGTSCVTLSSDWEKTHTLGLHDKTRPAQKGWRYSHSAWASPKGVMLFGGVTLTRVASMEILTEKGDSIPGFSLDIPLNYLT